ncbi:MAG: long-chain fatty acid--CoA ligase, partial [Micrococcales bacterium]|nr:long-chain fatty acid--CoA ligase [Micrococcales bacterium]
HDVADAAVVGIPAPSGGERVVAVVLLRPGAELDVAALREWCRDRLAAYKVPRDIVALSDLPRSMLGKILRKEVREHYLSEHGS